MLSIFFVLQPHNAFAVVSDESATAAQNLANYINPITTFLFDLIKQYVEKIAYLLASAYLLQTAVNYSPGWIDINSLFVQTGLNITTAIANIMLIAAFITIALGYVFNIDKFNNKKILIKFFISALLVNFAPLFVGMVIDIANIILASIMVGNEALFTDVFSHLALDAAGSLIALLGAYSLAASASSVGTLGLPVILATILGASVLMITVVPHYLIQLMSLQMVIAILFSYGIFFLTRVFVIQILAIVAPMAILAGTIPQGEKWFDFWKSWLLTWSFGGILMLFLLTLGLTSLDMLGSLPESSAPLTTGGYVISSFMEWHLKWFALAIYMTTVEAMCLVAIPELSKQIGSGLTSGGDKLKSGFEKNFESETSKMKKKNAAAKAREDKAARDAAKNAGGT